jgi:hypothetical protein
MIQFKRVTISYLIFGKGTVKISNGNTFITPTQQCPRAKARGYGHLPKDDLAVSLW